MRKVQNIALLLYFHLLTPHHKYHIYSSSADQKPRNVRSFLSVSWRPLSLTAYKGLMRRRKWDPRPERVLKSSKNADRQPRLDTLGVPILLTLTVIQCITPLWAFEWGLIIIRDMIIRFRLVRNAEKNDDDDDAMELYATLVTSLNI